ncbi:MAG: biotin--[acetyl-CoA-carboxylase] ligase, partial [Deltaproteobacteria bacterium]|nr:biotin--[acetyl-CoA-carboxylase] ligase [Deltaproteobacteria bacterium]
MTMEPRQTATKLGAGALRILEALGAGHVPPRALFSGAELSTELEVSRTQIWKHVEQLRARGYQIEGAAGGGYQLKELPDRLYPELIRAGLQTQTLGQHIEHFECADSTNRIASELARKGAAHGTVVVAEEQTSGRGRLGRSFYSPAHQNLYLSAVLRPNITAEAAPLLVLSTAIAVAELIASEVDDGTSDGDEVSIRWPNDVLLRGKQTSGILLEMHAEGARVDSLVLGIGINLNVDPQEFPEEFRSTATSLSASTGRPIDRIQFTQRLLIRLEEVLDQHLERGFEALRPRFERRFHMQGKAVNIDEVDGQRYSGTVLGIDG